MDEGRAAKPGAAGWYPDPYGRHAQRHWNGVAWTSLVANGRQVAVDEEPVTDVSAGASTGTLVADPPGQSDRVRTVASAQRLLLLCILVNVVVNFLLVGTRADLGLLAAPIALASVVFYIWCVYRLCRALEVGTVLWVTAMCVMVVPLVNFIFLVVLNRRATRFLQDHGVKVGLLGSWD